MGTRGHPRHTRTAGHTASTLPTSADRAAWGRVRSHLLLSPVVRLDCRRVVVALVVSPSIPADPGRPSGGRAVPTLRIRRSPAGGLRADGGPESAQPQVPGGVCRRRLLCGVRRGPWPRSWLSALWSAVPVRRPGRRDMAWGGRPGRPPALRPTGLRRVSHTARATQHRRSPLPADDRRAIRVPHRRVNPGPSGQPRSILLAP